MPEAFYFKPCEIRKREDAKMKWKKKKVRIHFRSCNGLEAKLVHFEGVQKENLIHSPVGTDHKMLKVKYVNTENYLLKTISLCAWKNFFQASLFLFCINIPLSRKVTILGKNNRNQGAEKQAF